MWFQTLQADRRHQSEQSLPRSFYLFRAHKKVGKIANSYICEENQGVGTGALFILGLLFKWLQKTLKRKYFSFFMRIFLSMGFVVIIRLIQATIQFKS